MWKVFASYCKLYTSNLSKNHKWYPAHAPCLNFVFIFRTFSKQYLLLKNICCPEHFQMLQMVSSASCIFYQDNQRYSADFFLITYTFEVSENDFLIVFLCFVCALIRNRFKGTFQGKLGMTDKHLSLNLKY